MDRIKTADVARGRWPQILQSLGVPREMLSGRHQPCVFCGGKDRARFTDFEQRGWYLCNQCGKYDGFRFLMKIKGWTFKQAADEIDKLLANDAYVSLSRETSQRILDEQAKALRIPKSLQDCALWLRKFHPNKLEAWLESKHPEVRWWLECQEPVDGKARTNTRAERNQTPSQAPGARGEAHHVQKSGAV